MSQSLICRSVMIQPGTTHVTRIPCGPRSRASPRVSPTTADLAAVYPGIPPCPTIQEVDPRFTIAPPPAAAMSG